jgi:hypothetical protein
MMPIEALRLFILSIDDKRVDGNFGPGGTVHGIPQEDTSEFEAMIGKSDGKASQAGDGNRRITWQTLGKRGWHLDEEDSAGS